MRKLPADLADVVGPLREAEDYARLQEIRQRGLYNIITGLPGLFFLVPLTFGPLLVSLDGHSTAFIGIVSSLVLVLFILACFPQVFMPVVRRYRPDWQSPLLQSSLLKNGLEKQFWLQFLFWVAYVIAMPFVGIFFMFQDWGQAPDFDDFRRAQNVSLSVGFTLHVVAMAALAWHARRNGDRWMMWAFLAWIPTGVSAFFDPDTQVPSLVGLFVFAAGLVTPSILIGLVRLLAPRRWLVR